MVSLARRLKVLDLVRTYHFTRQLCSRQNTTKQDLSETSLGTVKSETQWVANKHTRLTTISNERSKELRNQVSD
jgi:hypothetical protein